MVGLGELEGGGFYSAATDISFDGSTIVGGSIDEDGAESVLWRDGAMLVLGDLSGAGVNSYARGVSGDGSIVVGYGTVSPTVERAYIWDAAHGMRRLDELLTSLGLDVSHYALTSATDI